MEIFSNHLFSFKDANGNSKLFETMKKKKVILLDFVVANKIERTFSFLVG